MSDNPEDKITLSIPISVELYEKLGIYAKKELYVDRTPEGLAAYILQEWGDKRP